MKAKSIKIGLILTTMLTLVANSSDQAFAYEFAQPSEAKPKDNFYLSFSIGDGAYINYRCSDNIDCRSVFVTPLDFEVVFGLRLSRHFYLDLGVNWGVDYSDYIYDRVSYMAGVRPGVRSVLPFMLRRSLYFRGAIPLQYALETEDDHLIVGILLGIGFEWLFGNVGLFGEIDISPYFIEVYPGHYAIPAQGRIGISFRF